MTNRVVKCFAPATVANVACAFDVLGFALSDPGDEVSAEFRGGDGDPSLREIIGGDERLHKDLTKNTALVAVQEMLRSLGERRAIDLRLWKHMPLGSGMGSSAASSAAALVAVNHLLGEPLTRRALVPFAQAGERAACGSAHADNVAPSLLGGFVLVRSYDPLDLVSIPVPPNLCYAVVHPELEVATSGARRMLRQEISLRTAVMQWGNVAGLIAGLFQGDFGLIGRSLEDYIVEPQRAVLVTGFAQAKAAALQAGACGFSFSGSGPAVFALAEGIECAQRVGSVVQETWNGLGVKSTRYVGMVNAHGARIVTT